MFKLKIEHDKIAIVKAKAEDLDDFDNILKDLKIKYKGKR